MNSDWINVIAIILLLVWLAGMTSGFVLGGFIHVFLVIAIVMLLIAIVGGPR